MKKLIYILIIVLVASSCKKDDEDRKIEILEGEGWCIQRDNMLPRAMKKGETIFITKGEIHRVLKGTTDLKIKIN